MHTKNFSVYRTLMMMVLIAVSLLFIFPFYWIITGSFKLQKVAIQMPPQWFPTDPTFANFKELFINPAGQWFFNSIFMSVASMFLVCLTSAKAGYVLAKKQFSRRGIVFAIIIAAMALPKQVVFVPLVRIMNSIGMYNTPWAVILPAVGWPFGVFLMKQFAQTIPGEILDAARIDGSGEWMTFVRIVTPIIKPAYGALAIFTFISTWNDYFLQLVMLQSRSRLTISLGVATLQAEMATNYGVIMAGAALGALPIVLIFLLFQKYFASGITMGAVKG
ncbi:MAG: carbohydrate ABC transporter permease [Spirochaetales bacterium]|nr:carbohydrate ABC transporter permease [Spirochaetales bacterium]